ncbi:hypothetical protein Tco_1177324 [Tanacetum coccineum]
MTTPINNSQMHNDIMIAGSKERPPMLTLRRYAQWQSCFLRYVDMKSKKKELKQCIFDGPYVMTEVIVLAKPTTSTQEAVHTHTFLVIYGNTIIEKRAYIDAEAEAIHMILSRIRDDIYSIVDACTTTKEIDEESIELYYSRFYKMMNEMIINKLEVATMQVNVQFLQQLQPEWSRFVTVIKQTSYLDTISYHKLFDILKQYQNEVNDIHAEKIARNKNPLALIASTQQYPDDHYQAPKPYKTYAPSSKQTPSTRSHATTRNCNTLKSEYATEC